MHLTDWRGIFEHAAYAERREEHGYCTDDNARLLIVATRAPQDGPGLVLTKVALKFLVGAQGQSGLVRNRMDRHGHWTDTATSEDCWGRAVWAFGVAASQHEDPEVRTDSMRAFQTSAHVTSPWPRAMAFAALGAADVLAVDSESQPAVGLLQAAALVIPSQPRPEWRWLEPRLTYANAAVAEALIATGYWLGSDVILDRGLNLLRWLLDIQTRDGHLSVVGAAGRGPEEIRALQFDQQPIEIAALADACVRAWGITQDGRWLKDLMRCYDWFDGDNDVGARMWDTQTGGGYDGLTPTGPNLNQGAESTLACISTMQRTASVVHASEAEVPGGHERGQHDLGDGAMAGPCASREPRT